MLSPWVQFVHIKLAAVEQWNFLIKLSCTVIGKDIFACLSSLLKALLDYSSAAKQGKYILQRCFPVMYKSTFSNESTN